MATPRRSNMSSDHADPILPPELERLIFIYALKNDLELEHVVNLLIIARRVHDWLIPSLFEVVVVYTGHHWPTRFNLEKFQKYGKHVRHLLLCSVTPGEAAEFIPLCPNLTNLALWTGRYDTAQITAVMQLHLTRLSVEIRQLGIASPAQLTLFSTITHLDVGDVLTSVTHCQILIHFPVLTHVALVSASEISVLKWVLEQCKSIKVVVWVSGMDDDPYPVRLDTDSPRTADPRVVALACGYVKDWIDGAHGGLDMWKFADGIIAARRSS
ncbi:hypothetical protein BDN72DRAFT_961424 [Pluteus cervinus]|uniref:Uncharacterized protein n=1 Tax=Pluteus cervinus TaxID=181527 RepID=A0ACD3ANI8_9AGAR|nr:hypothetical protein BDN72DRAFT_961424 [Pluteus cervinus]